MRKGGIAVALVIAGLLVPSAAAGSTPARFDVGTAVVDITPSAPQYLGGYDRMDTPTADAHDPLQVRAFFVGHGRNAVAFAIVDTQGWFAGYQEGPYGVTDAREQAAAWLRERGYRVTAGNLIVSSTHSHAAPTLMGIWGPTDPAYLREVHDAAVRAIEEAESHAQRAELWVGSGSIRSLVAQNVEGTDHFDGWGVDTRLPVLWARDPKTLATIGVYANVPVHADQFRGSKYRQMSADYPGYVRSALDSSLGGTAVIAMGTLGRQEALGGEDDYPEVARQGRFIVGALDHALAHSHPITSGAVAGAQQYVPVPAHNPALLALLYANEAGFACNDTLGACTIDRSIQPPYLAGNVIGTWVTALRIGHAVWVSEPGEAFPEVSAAIRRSIGARAVNVVGMAQDQLGYYYPPEDYPASELNPSDFILFNVSPTLADESVDAAALAANRIGLVSTPQHPRMDDEHPRAFFTAGTQFWPSAVESADPTVDFLGGAKPSEAPVLPLRPGHSVSDIAWRFGDGTTARSANDERISHTFPGPGRYTVTSSVTNERGIVRRWHQLVVIDRPPSATVDVVRSGAILELTAGVSGGDRHAIAAHWAFSDGTSADGITVSHPADPGLEARVTVVDGAGDAAQATVTP